MKRIIGAATLLGIVCLTLYLINNHKTRVTDTITDEEILRQAAQDRLKNGRVVLRLGNGQEIPPRNSSEETDMKVNLFKKMLALEAEQKGGGFRAQAEHAVEGRRPAEIRLRWMEITGDREKIFVAPQTRDCGLPEGQELELTVRDLRHLSCVSHSVLRSGWDSDDQTVTIEVRPLTRADQDWKRMVLEEEKELASKAFVQSQKSGTAWHISGS